MPTPQQRLAHLLAAVAGPSTCAADLLCDTHPADAIAVTVIEPDLSSVDLTFGDLRDRSARVAAGLAALGIEPGDRVATLMGKSAELVVALLAVLRLGAVHVPLFTAFAPPAIAARIIGNGTKIVITDPGQRPKLEPSEDLPADGGWQIITTGTASGADITFEELLAATPRHDAVAVGADEPLIELFTSGTTGSSKGVPVPLRAIAAITLYQEYGLDHQEDDVFWNAADPGWAYGLYYGIVGPLALGRRSLLLRGGFSPETTWSVLSKFGVTNFAAGPTVYRALRNADVPVPADLKLRHCSSAGEPLDSDGVAWATRTLGVPIRDHYGQTELGMVAANGWHPDLAAELKPGSMGRALPGWHLDVLRPGADEIARAGERGRLAVDLDSSPLMWFTGYRDAPHRTVERFTADGRWYLTGDTATKDTDGYIFFTARDDDVILMAGYRIGPFDVESVLLEHHDVAEAAVVGEPDQLRGEIVVAHIVLRPGSAPSDELAGELKRIVKDRYAAHAYPRKIHFVPELPKTPSGKLQRFLLRVQSRNAQHVLPDEKASTTV